MNLTDLEPGLYLRRVRNRVKMTQEQLADLMPETVDQPTINRYESGRMEPGIARYVQMVSICDPDARLITCLEEADE